MFKPLSFDIDKNYKNEFQQSLIIENTKRFMKASFGIFVVEFLVFILQLVLFKDNSDYAIAKIMKLVICAVALTVFFTLKFLYKYSRFKQLDRFIKFAIFITFVFAMLNSILAQNIVTDVYGYLLIILVITTFLYLEPKFLAVLYFVTLVILSSLLFNIHGPQNFVYSAVINSALFKILALMISRTMYKQKYTTFVDHKIIIEKNKNLEHLSTHDGLTNLINHKTIIGLIDDAILSKSNFSLAIFDLDNFKNVNDIMGHKKGDEVLIMVANIFTSTIDTNHSIARLGGDEFIVLFRNCQLSVAINLCKSIKSQICNIDLTPLSISTSCGITNFDEANADNIYEVADRLMYKAKNNGKNRIVYEVENEEVS